MATSFGDLDWKHLRASLKRVVQRFGYTDGLAEDLVQEICATLLVRPLDSWREVGDAMAYAATVARNAVRQDIRRSRAASSPVSLAGQEADIPDRRELSDSAIKEYLHLMLALRRAVQELPRETQEDLLAFVLDRGAMAARAKSKGIHRGTLSRRIGKAMATIRTSLVVLAKEDLELGEILAERGFL